MICIYDKKTTKDNFNNNGLAVLDECIVAEVTEELNGEYSLYIEYPADSRKATHLVELNIIKANEQLFRIYKVERQQEATRRIKVWARHIFYDLAFYFIESVNLVNANMKEAIEGTIPPEAQAVFEFLAPERNIYPIKLRNINALEGLFNLIEIYGGELIRDNFTTEILEKLGEDKGTTIRYGKNIKGLKAIIDTSEFATRIYPIGDNNLVLQERYIEAEGEIANILPYPITRKVEFSGCKDVEELRELAKKYIKKVSNPFINITVELLELSKTKEYGKYAKLFNMELGDIVKVEHERLGIYSELRVIKKVTDLLNHINTKIELGNPLNTIINKLDFNSVVKSLESRIEGAQNAVILKKNTDAMSISSMSFYQAIAVAISALADTNLSCSLTVSGVASDDLAIKMRFALDGEYYEFQPSQNLAKGDNVISITILIPQVTAGQHAFVIEMQTSNGTFHIDKNNLQVFIEGRHLEGGLNPSLPRAEVMQAVLYVIYSNKIKNYKDSIVTSEDITHLEDRVAIHFQEITYSEAINKGPKTMNTKTTISMKVAGFSHIADKIFYLNLNTDDWVMHFSEFKNIGSNNWILDHYITLTEKNDITKSSIYSYLGDGIVYEINFGSRDEYKDIIQISSGLKEIEA
jgi:phage minor structural protein